MSRSQRLAPIQDYNRRREEQAAQRLQEANARLRRLEQQIEQLRSFRREYAEQINQLGQGGVSLHRVRLIQDFIARLDELIAEQEQQCQRLREDCEAARRAWLDEHRRRRALDTLVERYRDQERREAARAEQKAQDERAGRRR